MSRRQGTESENLQAAREQQAGAPAPEPKKRQRSDNVIAGHLVDKLEQLDADEADEIARCPEVIRAKYEEKRAKALDGASETVRDLVAKMRAT